MLEGGITIIGEGESSRKGLSSQTIQQGRWGFFGTGRWRWRAAVEGRCEFDGMVGNEITQFGIDGEVSGDARGKRNFGKAEQRGFGQRVEGVGRLISRGEDGEAESG